VKLRNLLLLIAGISIGWWLANKRSQDDPNVLKGPREAREGTSNPAVRMVSSQAQRLADQATAKSLDAIRRARGAIRERLADSDTDDALWN
jgi:hypothetical protein